jgi:hypothetical protein
LRVNQELFGEHDEYSSASDLFSHLNVIADSPGA